MKYWLKNSRNFYIFGLIFTSSMVALSYFFLDLSLSSYYRKLNGSFVHHFFEYVTKGGDSLPYIIIALFGYLIFKYFRKNQEYASKFLLILESVAISGIAADLLKWIAGRYRPCKFFDDNLYGFDFFHIQFAFVSFPSGHTATAFAFAAAMAYLFPKKQWIWWVFAILVGFSRIVLIDHYLSDVIGGAFVGIASVVFILTHQEKFRLSFVKKNFEI